MQNQSFRQVFVAKTGKLLGSGTTLQLAPDQIGIFDYPSYKATAAPAYNNNPTLIIARGVAPAALTMHSFLSNSPEYTKEISGMRIHGWRAKKARKGRNEVFSIGFDGYDTTKTLFARCGEVRHVYIRLSGRYINELYSEKGITRQFALRAQSCSDCADNCANVDTGAMADDLVTQMMADAVTGKFIRAKKLQYCTNAAAPATVSYTQWQLDVPDGGQGAAQGLVQSEYPDYLVTYAGPGTAPFSSRYTIVTLATVVAMTDFSNAAVSLIADCNVCPAGYTQIPGGFSYKVTIQDNGVDKTAELQAMAKAVAGSARKIGEQFGQGTYTFVTSSQLLAADITAFQATEASAAFLLLGEAGTYCVLTNPGTISWVNAETLVTFPKNYQLTLRGECGHDRLADVQAAYPRLTIVLDAPAPDGGTCIYRYKTIVQSNLLETGCAIDVANWIAPDPFEGTAWEETPVVANVNSTCAYGVEVTVGLVDRVTTECTYDYWPAQFDTVHVQISEYNPDYNADPDQQYWPISRLQSLEYPIGTGNWVREQEKKSLSYQLRERSMNPLTRELEAYRFAADPNQLYDEYTLEYSYSYMSGGWTEKIVDRYHLSVYFPTGQGKQYEAAINGYVSNNSIGLLPQIL